ncbi:hypothetical protein PV325_008558 [Microctonus aethiopoides]|nr:hypothetical protein PV325_008558 [Microctonus aethiopoides]
MIKTATDHDASKRISLSTSITTITSSLVPPFMTTTVCFILSSTTTSVHSFKSNTKSIFCNPVLGDPLASLAINNLVILIIDCQVFRENLLQVNHKQSRKVNSSSC